MALSGTLKERLKQYKALKEEEARKNARSITPQESEQSKEEVSWFPKSTDSESGIAVTEEIEYPPDSGSYAETSQNEYVEEIIETSMVRSNNGVGNEGHGSFAEEAVMDDDETSFEDADFEASESSFANSHEVFEALDASEKDVENYEQDVFRALDEAERAEGYLQNDGRERAMSLVAEDKSNGVKKGEIQKTLITRPSDMGVSEKSVPPSPIPPATAAAVTVGATSRGESNNNVINDVAEKTNDEGKSKLNCIILGVIAIACLAIVAIVLPFVLDYPDKKTEINPKPESTPAPSVTSSTIDGNSTDESLSPSVSPTLSSTTVQWGQFMKTFAVPVSGEEVFQNVESPQYQAAKFILDDPYTSQLKTTEALDDRYATIVFYFATDGGSWDNCNFGDTNCITGEWLVGDVCTWFGVSCDDNGRVASYSFVEDNGLEGTLPYEMYLLSEMTSLVIVNNTINGPLPDAFGENATLIRSLLLPDNEITGSIPETYLQNSPLEFVDLSNNEFTGLVPTNLGGRNNINELNLSGNSLIGTIPTGISGYENLQLLSLSTNELTGSIPDNVYLGLTNLSVLHLDGNKISGTISPLIGDMQSLVKLRIGKSDVSGAIPDELLTLTNLEELDISRAQLEGRLSGGVLNLESLRKLVLNNNNLEGTVPATLGRLSSLTDLVLQGNEFTGTMPDSICWLRDESLVVLTTSCNKMTCDCCTTCF